MKEINLKAAMKAYRNYEQAEHNKKFMWDTYKNSPDRSPYKKAQEDSAKAKANVIEEAAKLWEVLENVQERAIVRLIDDFDVLYELAKVEDKLGISKKAMDGITVEIDPNAETLPGSYKGIPESTQFTARYKNGWYITDIYRAKCKGKTQKVVVNHTDTSRAAIIERLTTWAD